MLSPIGASADEPGAMCFESPSSLRAAGFVGFHAVRELVESRLAEVPELPGVYVLLRPESSPPRFLEQSPAGLHKGRDPTLPVSELNAAWVPETPVIYIGKAGGPGLAATLRSRLRAYLAHGRGRRVGHWGGRAVWQLADAAELQVAWRAQAGPAPREVERELIARFVQRFGSRPFANRTG